MPHVVETIAGARALTGGWRAASSASPTRVALVPTMGALHDGHLALIDRARQRADRVLVSIFVNPLQFGAQEDLGRYPRDLDADLALLEARGVDAVFAPTPEEMYPTGPVSTRVTAGEVGTRFEGRSRRGHFDGVLTVVAKLLNVLGPDIVVFGEKDAQQLFLVRRMVTDLDLDVAVEAVATVRDHDGLALSSRNRYLDDAERRAARALPAALEAAESSADRGTDAVLAAAQSVLTGDAQVDLDYLALVHPSTFLPVDTDHRGRALLLVAARVGDTRLIDNSTLHLG